MSEYLREADWSIARFVRATYRYKGRALLAFSLVVVAGVAALLLLPKEYVSEARLFLRIGRENVAHDPTITNKEGIGLTATRDVEMNSILEHLQSRALYEMVFERLRPDAASLSPVEHANAVRKVQRSIFVDAPESSAVVILNCEARSPEQAKQTLDAFVDVYLDEHMRIHQSPGSRDFFDEQVELLRQQVESIRGELRDAKSLAGMTSLEGQRNLIEAQLINAHTRIGELNAELSATKASIAEMESSVGLIPDSILAQFVEGIPNDGMAAMRQTLFELRSQEQEVLSKRTEAHPMASSIRDRVENVEEALKAATPQREAIVLAIMVRSSTKAKSLMAEKQELESQLIQLQDQLTELNEKEGKIESLAADLKHLETRYLVYLEKMEEARMEEALHADRITNVSIIQSPTFVATPIRPRRAVILLLAIVTGMFCSVGVVLASDQRPRLPTHASRRVAGAMTERATHGYQATEEALSPS